LVFEAILRPWPLKVTCTLNSERGAGAVIGAANLSIVVVVSSPKGTRWIAVLVASTLIAPGSEWFTPASGLAKAP